jgi:hypothetical protein
LPARRRAGTLSGMPELRSLRYLRVVLGRRGHEIRHRAGLGRAAAYVIAFPKSGGTWIAAMIRDVVATHRARAGRSPLPVVHDHWQYSAAFQPAVYVSRDGRDVAVSLYFHHLYELRRGSLRAGHIDAYLRRVLGSPYDLAAVEANLPRFIASLGAHPFGGILRASGNRRFQPWPGHIADWRGRPAVLQTRYEDFIADTAGELGRVARWIGAPLPVEDIAQIAARHSFAAVTGRPAGEAEPTAFARKGIVGDWRNHFTRAAAEAYAEFAGGALIALGYEPNADWVRSIESSEPAGVG